MKKIFYMIIALVYLCLSAMPCAAAQVQGEAGSERRDVLVNVDYTPPEGEYRASCQGGSYIVNLDDGTMITVRPQSDTSELTLVIYPILEMDEVTYRWFEECAGDFGSRRLYYEMYFLDMYGNRVDGGKCDVTITVSDRNTTQTMLVAMLGRDGTLTMLTAKTKNQTVSFTAPGNGYYVLAQQEEEETKPTPTPEEETKPTPTPEEETKPTPTPGEETKPTPTPGEETKPTPTPGTNGNNGGVNTGDDANLMLWLSIFGGSAIVLTWWIVRKKRKKTG